jgi:NAD(P)-dependent dehydrogenase (short-subunit alcohol dehydrogenase family)
MTQQVRHLAIVTGSAHRLGQAFAQALARRGFDILLHYHLSAEAAEQTAAELVASGAAVTLCRADLTDPAQVVSLFDVVDTLATPLGVLVNSAATMPRGDIRNLTSEEWDGTFAINLRAPLLCAQQAARRMEKGLIVNVTDIGAGKAWTRFPAYTVSKAALESLTTILARSLAPRVRVNAIAPGLVLPAEDMRADEWDRLVQRLPLRRPATLDEITSALEFLLDNEYVTGHTLNVDGGYNLL